jgi:hypothetical protein
MEIFLGVKNRLFTTQKNNSVDVTLILIYMKHSEINIIHISDK